MKTDGFGQTKSGWIPELLFMNAETKSRELPSLDL